MSLSLHLEHKYKYNTSDSRALGKASLYLKLKVYLWFWDAERKNIFEELVNIVFDVGRRKWLLLFVTSQFLDLIMKPIERRNDRIGAECGNRFGA